MADLCLVLLVVADNGEDSETAADLEDARCVLLLVLMVDFFKLPRLLKTVHFCTLVVLTVVLLMWRHVRRGKSDEVESSRR